jgi:hypothetical protein
MENAGTILVAANNKRQIKYVADFKWFLGIYVD